MSEQLTIADALAQQGMDSAVNAADLRWVREAQRWIDDFVGARVEFTAEDVLRRLEWQGLRTRDNRALGGILRSASREGRIRATGEYRKGTRPQSHARPQAVWIAA